jgi:hypothetical protein
MRIARRLSASSSLLLCALVVPAAARAATDAPPEIEKNETPTTTPPTTSPHEWAFDASGFLYVTPDDTYFQPSFAVDHRWLHLEARYNYEDRQTASTWVGYNFSTGELVTLAITPIVAAVFGATNGVAVGAKGRVTWRWLELYSEGEGVFSFSEKNSSFIYFWSTLAASPFDWLHLGLAAQRTRAYQTTLDIQRGFLLGLSIAHVGFTAYMFNPDLPTPTYVFALDVNW